MNEMNGCLHFIGSDLELSGKGAMRPLLSGLELFHWDFISSCRHGDFSLSIFPDCVNYFQLQGTSSPKTNTDLPPSERKCEMDICN